MDLENHLEKAESAWLNSSFNFLKEEFEITPLPSHDHFHHLRVWKHGKNLLTELGKLKTEPGYEFTESLLLSCMFHDSGMLKTKGNDHGRVSVNFFREFISSQENKVLNSSRIEEAIEKHDDKSFTLAGRLIKDGELQLLTALHISDDLDALGNIGIYRYSEIYLLRGIPLEDLGLKIIANLSGRYGNFISNCSKMPEMIRIHSMRHHTIESFFRNYNLQIRKKEETGEEQRTGPLAVVKNIYRQVLMNAPTIQDICENVSETSDDQYIQNFFKSLLDEI